MVFLSGFFQAISVSGLSVENRDLKYIETAALNSVKCLIHLNRGVHSKPKKLLVEI